MAMMMRGGGDEDNDEDCFQSSCGHFVNFRFGSFFFVLHCIGIGIFFFRLAKYFFFSLILCSFVLRRDSFGFSPTTVKGNTFSSFFFCLSPLSISPLSIVLYLKGVKHMCDVNVY